MGQFLNNKEPYDKYRTVKNGSYFVDKSEILEELIPALQQEQRFFCITRPKAFWEDDYGKYDRGLFLKIQRKNPYLMIFIFQGISTIKNRLAGMM